MTCRWYAVCPLRELERRGGIDDRWRRTYCSTDTHWEHCVRYRMEEEGLPHDHILPDGGRIPSKSDS